MVHVTMINEVITGIYSVAQPHLEGYATLSDDDPRIEAFINRLD